VSQRLRAHGEWQSQIPRRADSTEEPASPRNEFISFHV
jgi:hypothetical protein